MRTDTAASGQGTRPLNAAPAAKAAHIVLLYSAVAATWQLCTDLLSLDRDAEGGWGLSIYHLISDWSLIAVSAIALQLGLTRLFRAYEEHLHRNERQGAELRVLNQFRESIIDNASLWINVLDKQAHVTVWNQAAERISGYDRREAIDNPRIWTLLYPDDAYRAEIEARVSDILDRGAEVADLETDILTKRGERKTIAWSSKRLLDEDGGIVGSIAIGEDITVRKEAENALRERERELATLMSNLPGMAYRCTNDAAWTMHFVSEGCRELTGYEPDALIASRDRAYADLILEPDRTRVTASVEQALASGQPFEIEYRLRRKDGREIWVWEQGRAATVGCKRMLEGIILDITQRKQMEEQLKELAIRDPLTGLLNRRELERRLTEELARARRYGHRLGLLWIDVDRFKSINDRLGHSAGDQVLRHLCALLESEIRAVDTLTRFGGEELVVLLPEMGEAAALEVAERLRGHVERTDFQTGTDVRLSVTVSIGVASYPEHARSGAQLLLAADQAMYRAKEEGRNRARAWRPEPAPMI